MHPKLLAKEFMLTPVVTVSSDIAVFSPEKQPIIELLITTKLSDRTLKPIPMFSNTPLSQPPQWQDLYPDDFEVLHDRIVFNTTHFSLFTIVARLPTPTKSVKITPSITVQAPVELTLPEVSEFKVVIPPSSIESTSDIDIKVTANVDHPLLCEESADASACITLEPHGLQFKEKIPITLPIPDYDQITEMYSKAKLQFLYSSDDLDSTSIHWNIIPDGEYKIIKEGDQCVGIVYATHFSNWKVKWLNIPTKLQKSILGPIHNFRKTSARRLVETFSGRCQVFMSSETIVGKFLNFSIAALFHPLQEFHQIPTNYECILYDSEKTPITVKGSSLKLTIELPSYFSLCEAEKFREDLELCGNFSARADFNIALDSSATLVEGSVVGKLLIEHGEHTPHKMNLIKVSSNYNTQSTFHSLAGLLGG